MKICPQCGTQHPDTDVSCSKCGTPLSAMQPNEPAAFGQSATPPPPPPPPGYATTPPPNPAFNSQQPMGMSPQPVKGVGFGEAIQRCLKEKYACFEGRASRSEYWYFYLFQFLLCLGLFAVWGICYALLDNAGMILGGIICALVGLALLVPQIAVSVRRFHDSGKSGWWYLIVFVPYLGGLILFILMLLPSDLYPNKFGPVP